MIIFHLLQARYKYEIVKKVMRENMNVWLRIVQEWHTHTEPISMSEVRLVFAGNIPPRHSL